MHLNRPHQHRCVDAVVRSADGLLLAEGVALLLEGFDVEQAVRARTPTSRLARTQAGRRQKENKSGCMVGTMDRIPERRFKRYMIKQLAAE